MEYVMQASPPGIFIGTHLMGGDEVRSDDRHAMHTGITSEASVFLRGTESSEKDKSTRPAKAVPNSTPPHVIPVHTYLNEVVCRPCPNSPPVQQ